MTVGRASAAGAVVALLLAAPAVAAPDGGDAMIARARAAEAAQLRALARAPVVVVRTSGRFGDGKTTHTFESLRRVQYRADGTVSNTYERGHVDGKSVTEAELRKAMGFKGEAKERDDVLTWTLAPLSSPEMDVTALGAATGGGYTLRCRVTRDAPVSALTLVVDEKTGRKRTATLEMAGAKARLADRLETVLTYADDGAPDRLRSSFYFKLGWIERSAEVRSERVPHVAPPPPPPPAR
jgi:hypothetical protein